MIIIKYQILLVSKMLFSRKEQILMNKEKIKNTLKSNKMIFAIYYYLVSFILKFVGVFFKIDKSKLLFVVYGGQRYDDSPKVIYERLKEKNSDFRYIWAFQNPDAFKNVIPENEMVKIDSFSYFFHALSSGYWITNSSASRGLNFLKKDTKNIMFTHGMTGIKHIGSDINNKSTQFGNDIHKERRDIIFVEGNLTEINILERAMKLSQNYFKNTGLPRNDELFSINDEKVKVLRKKMGIPNDKKVILYAPTFRDNTRSKNRGVTLNPPINFDYWEEKLGTEYVLLFTAHYEISNLIDIPKSEFIINAFKYPEINDLLIVSDILISDYSSIFFDFALLERPIFSFAFDFDEYKRERGLYDGYEKLFCYGVHKNEVDLIKAILNINYDIASEYTKDFVKYQYFEHFDPSVDRCIAAIFEEDLEN